MRRSVACLSEAILTVLTLVATSNASNAYPWAVAAVSPDGGQIVVSWQRGDGSGSAAIVNLIDGRVEPIAKDSGLAGVAYSPCGRFLVYSRERTEGLQTILRDLRTGRERALPIPLGPPYGWREDGNRLAGIQRSDEGLVEVVFFSTSELGETLRVPVEAQPVPDEGMVWIKDTDDVAFIGVKGTARDVYAVESGEIRQVSTSGDVLSLATGGSDRSLIWARASKNIRYILMSLYEYDVAKRTVRRLPFPDQVQGINPRPAQAPVRLERVVLAPRLNRIALVTLHRTGGQYSLVLFTLTMAGQNAKQVRRVIRASGEAWMHSLTPVFLPTGAGIAVLHLEAKLVIVAAFDRDGGSGRVVARLSNPGDTQQ